ncbi:hypothetical protein MBLNU13_g00821t1 [Cladosporium sp. NU13]
MNAKFGTKSKTPTKKTNTQRPDHSDSDQDGPPQNRPTSKTAIALIEPAGGTHGSISLSQTEQRVRNAAAIALEGLKSYNHEADSMYHHATEAHRLQDAVDLAILQSDAEADAAVDATSDMIDLDGIDEHLLEEGA